MDKNRIIEEIKSQLREELELLANASRDARAGAIDEDAKSEGKFDMRATEANYIADGQAKVAAETLEALEVYQDLVVKAFPPDSAVQLGALVEVEQSGLKDTFFVGPRSGGIVVKDGGREIAVITPQSPVGRGILGRRSGETVEIDLGASKRQAKILSVE